MAVNVADAIKELLANILNNRDSALQFVRDPNGTLIAQGVTEGDLAYADVPGALAEVCGPGGVPQGLQSYANSGGGGAGQPPYHAPGQPQTPDQVIQHLTYVTQVAYEGDETIITEIIDNSVDIDVEGDLNGDVDIDNTTATHGGVASSGEGDVIATTGDNSSTVGVGGDNFGQVGGPGAVVAGGNIDGPVNTGTLTGVQADGPVNNAIVGDENQAVQLSGSNAQDAVFNFGAGSNIVDVSSSPGATTALGGDATNQIGNVVGPGGALSGSGDASGSFQDNDTTNTDNSQDNDTTNQDSFNQDNDTSTSTATSQYGDANAESDDGDQDASEQITVPEV
jgi:hypothetical protein